MIANHRIREFIVGQRFRMQFLIKIKSANTNKERNTISGKILFFGQVDRIGAIINELRNFVIALLNKIKIEINPNERNNTDVEISCLINL